MAHRPRSCIHLNSIEVSTNLTQHTMQVSGLVEIALIAGDIKFMVEQGSEYSAAIPTRAAFAVLTCINLILVVYLAVRLLKYHHRKRRPPVKASAH